MFTTLSCLAPSILCCTRFFQGYGPPPHYIEFFTPFNYISIFAIISSSESSLAIPSAFKYIMIIDFCACFIRLTISFINEKTSLFKSMQNSNNYLDDGKSFISKYLCQEEQFIISYIHNIKPEKTGTKLKFAAARAGHHQMIIEVACLMASNKYKDSLSQFYLDLIAFPYIDSGDYSFYDNWQWIFTTPKSLQEERVTHLFINLNNPSELSYAQKSILPKYNSPLKVIKSNTQLSIIKFT